MKITSIGQSGSIAGGNSARARGPAEKVPASDEVQLTNLSTHLAAQSNSLARLGKLSQLTDAVASGGYHVEASVVSNSIIEDRLRAKAA